MENTILWINRCPATGFIQWIAFSALSKSWGRCFVAQFTLTSKVCIQIPFTVFILFQQFNWMFLNWNVFYKISSFTSECTIWCIMSIIVFAAPKWSWKDLKESMKLYLAAICDENYTHTTHGAFSLYMNVWSKTHLKLIWAWLS